VCAKKKTIATIKFEVGMRGCEGVIMELQEKWSGTCCGTFQNCLQMEQKNYNVKRIGFF